MRQFTTSTASLLLLAAAGYTPSSAAGEFAVELGGFWAKTDSWISTRAFDGEDIKLDFEDTLNMEEDQFLPYAKLSYKFNERHAVYFDWKSLKRNSETTSKFGFTIPDPDNEYDLSGVAAGAKIRSRLDIDTLRLGYAYNIYKEGVNEFGISLGLHVMLVELAFSGELDACAELSDGTIECLDEPLTTDGQVIDSSVTAPLPDLGFYGVYNFHGDWDALGNAQAFYIKLDETSGYLYDLSGGIRYRPTDNWSADLRYTYYEVKADWEDVDLKYSFQGPQLTVGYRW
ncbi:hypothetical protein [Agarivorans sp. JK6]|uniref:hypothetical protein n=1 Tax=Agarivorans sp. JK6 TaxID=2997426 RepID=UPI00387326B2